MARAVWWTLAFASLASGARYVDYSEAKMPEYGSAVDYDGPRDSQAPPAAETDDYHERAPDAPPLDYKYEDDRGKIDKHHKGIGEVDEWQNSVKKNEKYSDDLNEENFDIYSSDETANFKSNNRPSKHRLRLKGRNPYNYESTPSHNRYSIRYGGNKKKVISDIDNKESFDAAGDDFQDDKSIDFEEGKLKAWNNYRETTVRIARRKPRDRFRKSERNTDEEDPILNLRRRPPKEDFRPEDETPIRPVMRRPQHRLGGEVKANTETDKRADSLADKKYDDYAEYYDMRRAQGMKEKLFKDQVAPWTTTIFSFPMRTRKRMEEDGLDDLRRLMNPFSTPANYDSAHERNEPEEPETSAETTSIRTTTTVANTINDLYTDEPLRRVLNVEAPKPISADTTTDTTQANITRTVTIAMSTETSTEKELDIPQNTTTEMSLAEKSRLSIMKKAQRKEMVKDSATKKPPVLMQVTNIMHTLVMVEPATNKQPWQRVNVVQQDTPENVMKVKRLMRQKLLANAKNIHDLSENWDDTICDYIDMSLIETKATSVKSVCASLIVHSLFALILLH